MAGRTESSALIAKLFRDKEPYLIRPRRPVGNTDLTVINLGLCLANIEGCEDRQNYLPLGPLYIASYLQEQGYSTDIVDYQLFTHAPLFAPELFIDSIGETASLVGISCMANLLPFALLCARCLKDRRPDRHIVLGGVGPSPVASEIVDTFPFVSTVVEGEGEIAAAELVRGRRSPLPAPNRIANLDRLPLPAYSLLDLGLYDAAPSIVTSRGCPYRCAFCTEPHNFGGTVRFRSVESVVQELELVHALSGKSMFLFQDDILPLDRSRFRRLLRAMREDLSFRISWKCFARVDLVDEELMREMAGSGCVQVRYGIESGSNNTLGRIAKGFTIEKAFEIAAASVAHFPSVHASFIWGYPFEDQTEFEKTLRAASEFENAGITIVLFEFSPLPGSSLYHEFKDTMKLMHSRTAYSLYVGAGLETVRQHGQEAGPEHDSFYRLIEEHPSIFPGFYEFEGSGIGNKRHQVAEFALRKPIRNQYDL